MGISGKSVSSPNHRLTFLAIVFVSVIAFGSILYWRQQSLVAAEYVEFPKQTKQTSNKSQLHSKNFQIDTEEVSPTVK